MERDRSQESSRAGVDGAALKGARAWLYIGGAMMMLMLAPARTQTAVIGLIDCLDGLLKELEGAAAGVGGGLIGAGENSFLRPTVLDLGGVLNLVRQRDERATGVNPVVA